jgi:murein DD-endopeptidase MepM/ murein hydrolase activator NlpD
MKFWSNKTKENFPQYTTFIPYASHIESLEEKHANYDARRYSMKKSQWVILVIVILVLVAAGLAGGYVYYILPQREVIAEPIQTVMIPDYLSRYTQEIQIADQKIAEQPNLFRDASAVTLQELHGFFDIPLKQKVVYQQIRAPGDPRAYRKGIHQGIDFYQTKRNDPIYAAAPGVVIRIDKDHQPLERQFRNDMLAKCKTTWNGTPGSVSLAPVEEPYGDVLDKLRGRQILLYHGKNAQNEPIISLYAHTVDVNHELSVYDSVNTDTIIGYIGNSGTSGEVEQNTKKENHLHMELYIGGMYWTPKEETEIGTKQAGARYTELQTMILNELAKEYSSPTDSAPPLSQD